METNYKHIEANIYNHRFWSTCIEPTKLVTTYKNQLIEAGKIMDIRILDHLIIAGNNFYSFRTQGLIS